MRIEIHHHLPAEAPAWLESALNRLTELIMTAKDDLVSAINDLSTQLAANNVEIDALLTKIVSPGTSDADVAAAVTSIRSLIKSNADEVAKAQAAAP